jgi:cupin fold WbuC family metalloprotein
LFLANPIPFRLNYEVRFKAISNEVCVAVEPIVKVGPEEIEWLKQKLVTAPRGRVRICAHRHRGDLLHEMMIALARHTYIRPHKHVNKSESFHVIEGVADVVVLDDQGRILELIPLGEPGSGRDFFYRLATPVYHTLFIRSDCLIVHETTNGPFIPDDAAFAPWAPPEEDAPGVSSYLASLSKAVAEFVPTLQAAHESLS